MTQTQKLWLTLSFNMMAFGNIVNGSINLAYLFSIFALILAVYSHGFHSLLQAIHYYVILGLPITVLSLVVPYMDGLWFVIAMSFLSCFLFSFSSFKTIRFTVKMFLFFLLLFIAFSFLLPTVDGILYTDFIALCAFGPLQISYLLKCNRVKGKKMIYNKKRVEVL